MNDSNTSGSFDTGFSKPGLSKRRPAVMLALCLTGVSLTASAEVHLVSIQPSRFSPNDITIAPGDSVRWTLTASGGGGCGYYGCGGGEGEGTAHTVTADDGSFSSGGPQESFVYERQFNTAGEILYFCEVHSSAGLNISTNMNGRITVVGAEPAFQINAGLNDAWFNPATPGQGFFVNVFPDVGQMFVAWFTYEVQRPDGAVAAELGEPGHRWLTAFGPYADDQAVLDIEFTAGGVFNASEPAPGQTTNGTLTLEFTGCNAGTLTYDIPSLNLSGAVPIERIALDNLPACEAAAAATN